jgi:hypothetical protein
MEIVGKVESDHAGDIGLNDVGFYMFELYRGWRIGQVEI